MITTVKAISRRIYHKSRRQLRDEASEGGNTAWRILSLAFTPLHDKIREREGQGAYISEACNVSETKTDLCCSDRHLAQHPTAQTLPDDVLLEIFDYHRQAAAEFSPWKWHWLAQVCRRWRSVVFTYPRRLDLRIVLTYKKPFRKTPKFWPALPIIIWYAQTAFHPFLTPRDEKHISDILKNPARICEIDLDITRLLLEKCASSLEVSFPALDHLCLRSQGTMGTMDTIVLPDNFLDASAPRLRILHLKGTAIPMLPQLLSSSKNLFSLRLEDIIRVGYFMAEDLALGLSAATQLKFLELGFHPFTNTPFSPILGGPLPSSSRTTLPSLTEFRYEGDDTYLRDFASRIDVPIVEQIRVSFFHESEYDTSKLCDLFGLGDLRRSSCRRTTHINMSKDYITFSHHFSRLPSSPGTFRLRLPFRTRHPTSLVTQVCLGLESQDVLSKVTRLEIEGCPKPLRWNNEWDPTIWFTFLHALTGLKRLHVAGTLASSIVSVLAQVTGEMICEILPALRELHFGRGTPASIPASIEPFIAERQIYGLPVSVHFMKLDIGVRQGIELD